MTSNAELVPTLVKLADDVTILSATPDRVHAILGGEFVTIRARRHDRPTRELLAKTRVYVDIDHLEVGLPTPPYGPKGDDTANDAAWRRYNRREVEVMATRRDRAFTALSRYLGEPAPAFRFSRKAGCSCGCSSGFIADRAMRLNPTKAPVDVWVTSVHAARARETYAPLFAVLDSADEPIDAPAVEAPRPRRTLTSLGLRRPTAR